jgi:hypothetical protein
MVNNACVPKDPGKDTVCNGACVDTTTDPSNCGGAAMSAQRARIVSTVRANHRGARLRPPIVGESGAATRGCCASITTIPARHSAARPGSGATRTASASESR